jgi:pyruvate/2-oxoglutarate dehydrogenase complex dihydrolipoamide acyltransferase (E2) component
MNYLQELKIARDGLSIELRVYHEAIQELRSYLLSDKFAEDTTVQVKDVLFRLSEAESAALNARNEHDNEAYRAAREANEAKHARGKANCERCGKFGYDWDDVAMHGYTSRLCRGCYRIAKRNRELAE